MINIVRTIPQINVPTFSLLPQVTELAGPKLQIGDRGHNFTGLDMEIDQEIERAQKVSSDLVGPIYDVDAVNSFKAGE